MKIVVNVCKNNVCYTNYKLTIFRIEQHLSSIFILSFWSRSGKNGDSKYLSI